MLLETVKSDAKADNPYLFFRGGVFHKCFYEMSLCRRCEEVWGGTSREKACICKNHDQKHRPRGKGSLHTTF